MIVTPAAIVRPGPINDACDTVTLYVDGLTFSYSVTFEACTPWRRRGR